ncbi:MAG: hypothetical protein LLG14_05550 [Nocardiaceae bacterium]|nr:hypothetical protein [Nocardiaceae bacterium]
MLVRSALIVGGLAAIAFGVASAFTRPIPELINAATWFAGGIALHDGLFAPLCLAVWFVLLRRMPVWVSVCSFLTVVLLLIAIPVLGRTLPNTTVLDRNYVGGLAVALTVVWAAGGLYALIRWRRHRDLAAAPFSVR